MRSLIVAIGIAWAGIVQAEPLGLAVYCMQNPTECRPSRVKVIPYSDDVLADLERVNSGVNRAIRPRADRPGTDVWQADVRAGDCEDYVMTKRRRLMALGYPASALRPTVTRARGQAHAVLVVRTTAGDFVLDNLARRVWKR